MAGTVSKVVDNLKIWSSAVQSRSAAGRGSNNKIELYGIKKLREFILELAVRGLLVPQDPNDEPAVELLKKLAAEKAALVKGGKIKKQKPLPLVEVSEESFELPIGWEWCRLSDVAFAQAGFAFKSKNFNQSNSGLPLIRIRDVGQPFSGTFYDGDYRDEFVVRTGDYLVSMDGNFRVAPWHGEDALLNQRVSRLVFFGNKLAKRFIAESLQQRLHELQGVKAYTTVDHLSGGQISASVIALPPAREQHRIVAKIDELMGLCDKLEQQQESSIAAHQTLVQTLLDLLISSSERDGFTAAWARIADHFDTLFVTERSIEQLKQTILQLAVMGKLVPQNPSDEPASEVLKAIATKKALLIKDGKIKKQKTLPAIKDDEKSFDLPKGWEWCRLQDVIDVRDGTHDSPKDALEGISYPLVTSRNFVDGRIDFDGARRISETDHLEICKRSAVEVDDILFSMIGGNIGNQVLVEDCRPFSVKNVALFKYFLKSVTLPRYIKIYTEELALELQDVASGGAQPFISLGALRKLVFALPPTNEQQRIVVKVGELMDLCDTLKSLLNNVQNTQLQLADAIVKKISH